MRLRAALMIVGLLIGKGCTEFWSPRFFGI